MKAMKRTAKILSVVLALALVIGAIAIVSSATEAAGIHVTAQDTYDDLSKDYKFDSNSDSEPNESDYAWKIKGRGGTVRIGISEDGKETPNQYLILENGPKSGSSNPYFGTGYGGANTAGLTGKQARPTVNNGVLTLNGTDIADWPFLVLDFDIMSPTSNWYLTLGTQLRAFLAGDNSLDSITITNVSKAYLLFRKDSNGTYIANNAGTIKKYVDPNSFTHVTVINESVATATTRGVNLHVYLDGEYFFSYECADFTNGGGVAAFHSETPHLSYDEMRFEWGLTNDATLSVGLDNITTRLFDKSYDGNLATVLDAQTTLDAWESNIYDPDNMPIGKAVCQIEGGLMYENLEKAVLEAPEGATIKLLADAKMPVTVSKLLTINLNGFSADIRAGEGYATDISTTDVVKVLKSTGMTTLVIWDDCYHDPICEDEDYEAMHPLYFEKEVAINEKLLNAHNPTYGGPVGNDGESYYLIGWRNVETGEEITADTSVTEADVAATFILLEPIYKKAVKTFEYVVDGITTFAYDDELTLNDVVSAADAGSTVKFLRDIDYRSLVSVEVKKKITIDLNGHTLKAMVEGSTAKRSLFKLLSSAADITLTSSAPGAMLFNEGWNSATGVGANGIFNASDADNAKITILANDAEGNPTITFFSGTMILGYSTAVEYYIDGGIYTVAKSDQMGVFDVRKAGCDATIKNAIFYVNHSDGAISFGGRNTPTDSEARVTVDNCVFIGDAIKTLTAPVVVTMTNCYVTGSVIPQVGGYATVTEGATKGEANAPGKVILGAGNYIGGNINEYVELADGVKLYTVPQNKEITYPTNTWAVGAANNTFADSSFDVKNVTENFYFDKMTSDKEISFVNVIWKGVDGKVIGESKAIAGATAVAPDDLKVAGELAKGWLDYVPAEWNESLVVPEGVDEYVITAKEGGKVTPVVAVDLFFNIRLTTHMESRVYVPLEVEGIEVTEVFFRMDRNAKYESNYGKFTINGELYSMVDGWPGIKSSIDDSTVRVKFTYDGVEYVVTKTINIVDYIDYIINYVPEEGKTDYSEKAKKLAVNTANYLYEGMNLLGNAAAAAKVAPYVDPARLYTIDKENLPEVDVSAIEDYVSRVELVINTTAPSFRIYLTDAGKAATVTLSTGANSATDTEYATLGYIENNNTGAQYLNTLWINITPAATAENPEPKKISFKFSITDYYVLLKNSGASEQVLKTVEAIYGYATSDEIY